jgi:colanic acid/amylovoran biosynthesis glycosyltransferase
MAPLSSLFLQRLTSGTKIAITGAMETSQTRQPLRLGYLVSRYPAISHTFVLREVLRLRATGFEIHTASINPPDRSEAEMSEEERSEAHSTYFVKQTSGFAILSVLLLCLISSPLASFRGLIHAIRLGRGDPRQHGLHLAYFVEAVMIGRWMQRRNLNHLHVHFATPAASVGMLVAKTFGVGFSLTVHGPDEFYDVSAHRLAEKIDAASFVCCIGQYCRSQLMKLSPPRMWNKFEIAPLGVDPGQFTPREEPPESDSFQLLCVGRLVAAKGQRILLEAARQLIAEGRPVRVSLAGDGPDREQLERFVDENQLRNQILFHGAVSQKQVRALCSQAHAFVLPSFAEGIPVALMEAMAMEVPCISTSITGIPELIESGKDGILVAPSDVQALCRAITKLMDDESFRRAMAENGRRKVSRDYNLLLNIERLGRIFQRRLPEAAETVLAVQQTQVKDLRTQWN